MRGLLVAIVLLVIFIPACTVETIFPTTYDLYVDSNVPSDWVSEATTEWSTFTGVDLRVHNESHTCFDACWSVHLATREQVNQACISQILGYEVIGCTLCVPGAVCEILLENDLSDEEGREVTIHEFGHGMSLLHHNTFAIMNAFINHGAGHVTCDDVQQYASLRGISIPCTDPRLNSDGPLDLVGPAQ